MFAFISIVISLIITMSIMFETKVQTKTRRRNTEYWYEYHWKETSERPKWPLWFVILAYVCCIVPILNILWSTCFIVWYLVQLRSPSWDECMELKVSRIVYSNKLTKFLSKEI